MSTPKNIGRPTSFAAACTVCETLGSGERAVQLVLTQAEAADDVFHHHDRAINDEAEVNRAEAHQVAGELALHHAGHGEEQGKRNGRRDDERRPPVAEQKQEHDNDKNRALEQVSFDRREWCGPPASCGHRRW